MLTLATLTALLNGPIGISLLAMIGSWIAGKGIGVLLKLPMTRKVLGLGLQSASVPAVILGKWLQAGPLHLISGPIVCLLVFGGFWLFSFMDKLLTYLKPDTLAMVEGLEKMLEEMGSTDRKLYIQAKTMTAPQVTAVSRMAEAVATPRAELSADQVAVLEHAEIIGADLQNTRLSADR